MNSSFGKGFSQGFRSNYKSFHRSNFFKNFTNNKIFFNMFNTKLNSPIFKIQLSNKYFSEGAIFLKNHSSFSLLGSNTLTGQFKNCLNELYLDKLDYELVLNNISFDQILLLSVIQSKLFLK